MAPDSTPGEPGVAERVVPVHVRVDHVRHRQRGDLTQVGDQLVRPPRRRATVDDENAVVGEDGADRLIEEVVAPDEDTVADLLPHAHPGSSPLARPLEGVPVPSCSAGKWYGPFRASGGPRSRRTPEQPGARFVRARSQPAEDRVANSPAVSCGMVGGVSGLLPASSPLGHGRLRSAPGANPYQVSTRERQLNASIPAARVSEPGHGRANPVTAERTRSQPSEREHSGRAS